MYLSLSASSSAFFISLIESKSNSDENLFFFPFLRFLARSLSCILWIVLYKSLQFQNVRKNNDVVCVSAEELVKE